MAFGKGLKTLVKAVRQADKAESGQVSKKTKTYVTKAIKRKADKRNISVTFAASYTDSGNMNLLGLTTTQGDGSFGERQGDKIEPTRLELRYSWQAGDENNICRLIIFQWHPDDNAYTPSVLNEVVDITGQGTSSFPLCHYIFDRKNFTVLHDSLLSVTTTGNNYAVVRTKNIYGKAMRNIRYTNGVSNGHNNIYYIAITDSALATHPQLRIDAHLFYNA